MTVQITTPIGYVAATEAELVQLSRARRLRGLGDQRRLFPHQG